MFNLQKFNAMLLKRNTTKQDVANYLGIHISSLYKRLEKGGDFTVDEIRQLINFFGKNEVLDCLFSCE